jgi:hypothetical protein
VLLSTRATAQRGRCLIAVLAAALWPALTTRADVFQLEAPSDDGGSIVFLWNQAALKAIREMAPGPTISARALAILYTSMFDAWAAYDASAVPTIRHGEWRQAPIERTEANKAKAVSFAAYRALVDLFPLEEENFGRVMKQLEHAASNAPMRPATPEGVGNAAAASVLEFRHRDGSNQLGDLSPGAYSDTTAYQPVNFPGVVADPGRWQPLSVVNSHGQAKTQVFLTPHWARVIPFALESASMLRPDPPARYPSRQYTDAAAEVVAISAGLTDVEKMTAEYFADGATTEFPPGHWIRFAEFVSRRDHHSLDDDVKMFFALGNALLDASIAAWDAKRAFDSERPATAIHCLYEGRMILAWAGPHEGTQAIRGENWLPYQPPPSISPPFPEYFSGHSVFSAAAAEILKSFTGRDAFGFTVTLPAGSSTCEPALVPASDLTLSFPTFSDAADRAGMSRRYGGIHFAQGDMGGRKAGRAIGAAVWTRAETFFNGTAYGNGVASRSPVAGDAVLEDTDAFNLHLDDVARNEGADAGGRARQDQVSGEEGHHPGDVGYEEGRRKGHQ